MTRQADTQTTTASIMDLRAGDTVSIHGAEFRTIESIRHGWRGNHRAARRAISIRYTNGDGSYFDSAMIRAEVAR